MKRLYYIWVAVLAGLCVVSFQVLHALPDGKLHLDFLDVGQGDGYLLVMPRGGRVVVDAGPGSNIVEPLRRKIGWMSDDIDMVVLTHFDKDHCEGVLAMLQSFHVKKLVITGVEQRTALQHMILARVVADHIPTVIGYSDVDFSLDEGVKMDLVWPRTSLAGKYFKLANETGIVYRLMVGAGAAQHCVLLGTADTGFSTEDALMRAGVDLRCDVLKVGHHGSRFSSSSAFLKAVSPAKSVISVGAKNTYGHPTAEALGRLAAVGTQVYRTDRMGTVEMIVEPGSGRVEKVKEEKGG